MGDFLAEMAAGSKQRASALRAGTSLGSLRERASAGPAPKRVVHDGFLLIAEVKRASPSEGVISSDNDAAVFVVEQATRYVAGGAGVISVLTEPTRFGGEMSHAAMVARAVDVPVMRKDFLVDPAQVFEARIAGCSGVLLIARMLSDVQMMSMLAAAAQVGVFVLLEAFDARDLERAGQVLSESGPAMKQAMGAVTGSGETGSAGTGSAPLVMLGLNTRDLSTLKVNAGALEEFAGKFPQGFMKIAESGVATAADAARVAGLGYNGVLVGTALMRAADPTGLARAMVKAGSEHR